MRGFAADAALTWRLLLRGDRQGRIGTVLATLGVAIAVVATLLMAAVPRALDAADARNVARTPIGDPGSSGMRISSSTELFEGRAWTRIYVADAAADSPRPPGVDAWPAPGQTLPSPELARILRQRGDAVPLSGTQASDVIGDAGLLYPDELISYEVYAGAGGSDVIVSGFGDSAVHGSIMSLALVLQLLVIVGIPLVLFLLVVMRLSLNSRQRRSDALHLIGVGPRRAARLFAVEMGAVAALGAAAGSALYAITQPVIAASGLLGLRWFAEDAGLPWWLAVLTVAVSSALTARLAHLVMTAGIARPWRSRTPRRWIHIAGLLLFLPASTAAVTLVTLASGVTGSRRVLHEGAYMPIVLTCLVAGTLGMVLLLPSGIAFACEWLSRHAASPTTRLGSRLAKAHATGLTPLAAGLAALVLLAGGSEAVLRGMYVDGVGDLSRVTVDVSMDDLGPMARQNALSLDSAARVVTVVGVNRLPPIDPAEPDAERLPLIQIATCPQIEALLRDLPGALGCTGRPQQFALADDPTALKPGTPLTIELVDGARRSVATPAEKYEAPGDGILLPPAAAPWLSQVKHARITFQASALDGSYEQLLALLHSRVPGARPMTTYKDPEALTRHLQYTAIVRTGTIVAAMMIALALALVMLDLRWRTRTAFAAQHALGISRRALRRSSIVQVMLPVAAGLALAVPFTLGISWLFTGYWGAAHLFADTVTRSVMLATALAAVTAIVGGILLGSRRFTLDDLADE